MWLPNTIRTWQVLAATVKGVERKPHLQEVVGLNPASYQTFSFSNLLLTVVFPYSGPSKSCISSCVVNRVKKDGVNQAQSLYRDWKKKVRLILTTSEDSFTCSPLDKFLGI